MIVIATDAPLNHRLLERLAVRSFGGLARTGAALSHGSGDYAIAFTVDRSPKSGSVRYMTGLFIATMEATEEAIIASLFAAESTSGHLGSVDGLPVDHVLQMLGDADWLEGDE